jgi:hypothetical protein
MWNLSCFDSPIDASLDHKMQGNFIQYLPGKRHILWSVKCGNTPAKPIFQLFGSQVDELHASPVYVLCVHTRMISDSLYVN